MTEHQLRLFELAVEAVLALVLILAMTWIVVSPANDEISKAALVIVASTAGFLFGRHTAK